MKQISSQLAFFLQNRTTQRNIGLLLRFLAVLLAMIVLYSIAFHFLMAAEGQQHTWVTGFYWTLTVMSTLGFGDITFQGDAGRAFSMLVLLSGVIFLLVVLPFTFIQFFYAPWLEAQSHMRVSRDLPEGTRDHVILTRYEPVTISLISQLVAYGRPYILLVGDLQRALALHDQGVQVIVGPADDLDSYQRARVADAALVVASGDDAQNTAIAFTVREIAERVPIVSLARAAESVDILQLAGASHVVELANVLGCSLARRTHGGATGANVIGRFGELLIAEALASGTPLVGKKLIDSRLRDLTGLTVVGMWERGSFEIPRADTVIDQHTVLVLAGSSEQLHRFDERVYNGQVAHAPVIILGGGRVGRAAAAALEERGVDYRIGEKDPTRVHDPARYVVGSAAELKVLEQAGIRESPSVIITTNDDATNVYLTIYCRRLRPDIHIVSRSTMERNVSTLHRAGADFVMSYAGMGANAIFNILERDDVVMLAEGLDVFRFPAPPALVGRPLKESRIRETTECSVVAFELDGKTVINPHADEPIPAGSELILIGTTAGERQFIEQYGK
ncbi:potassium channel protein [soil metagenome]